MGFLGDGLDFNEQKISPSGERKEKMSFSPVTLHYLITPPMM